MQLVEIFGIFQIITSNTWSRLYYLKITFVFCTLLIWVLQPPTFFKQSNQDSFSILTNVTLLAEPALKLRSGKWETHWNRDTWIARMVEEPVFRCWPSTCRSTGIHFQGNPTLALCMELSLQHWWKVCLGGDCLLRFLQWSVFFSHRCLQEPWGCPLHLLPLHRRSIRLCVHTH